MCTGQEKQIEVVDRDISQEDEEEEDGEQVKGEGEGEEEGKTEVGDGEKKLETQEEEVTIVKPKMKEFPGSADVIGVRIRAEPSFLVSCEQAVSTSKLHCTYIQ